MTLAEHTKFLVAHREGFPLVVEDMKRLRSLGEKAGVDERKLRLHQRLGTLPEDGQEDDRGGQDNGVGGQTQQPVDAVFDADIGRDFLLYGLLGACMAL